MKPATFYFVVNPQPTSGELYVLFSGHSQTVPQHHVGPKVLDYYLVHFVLSGKGRYHCRGKDYTLGPGDSFFMFPGELESYASDEHDPWRYCWVAFHGTRAESLLETMGITPSQPVTHHDIHHIEKWYVHIQEALASGTIHCDLSAEGYLRLLLANYHNGSRLEQLETNKRTETEQQIDKAIRWLTLQYDQPISIQDMASSLGYHRTHLSKLFKRHTGMSPMDFLLKIRMERVKLLMKEDLTIQQIAASVGYPDALYFSKQFKKWYGMSPSEYRKRGLALHEQ